MRSILSTLVSALWYASQAAASAAGSVFIFDSGREAQTREDFYERRTLSPVAARMVLAQRAGVEEFHSADIRHEEAMQAINEFGSRSQLFGQGEEERQQLFFLVEMDAERGDIFPENDFNRASSSFNISPLPSANSTVALIDDLLQQGAPPESTNPWSLTRHTSRLALVISTTFSDFSENRLQEIRQHHPDHDVIVITIGPSSSSSPTENLWGTYSMPNSMPSSDQPHHDLLKRQQQTEQPLEDAPSPTNTPTTTRLGALASSASPLRGIFPTCFPSLSTCNALTRNCSSHGSCALKYSDATAPDKSPSKNCYSCTCTPQKKENSQGQVSTAYYGGPACQKKDVSVEFWLIVLFSVAMVGLVGFAVGSVWEMGEGELPSVIGAGVSGPVARR